MANARKKKIDNTYLSLALATQRGFVHRDYAAHYFRWSSVLRLIGTKPAGLLDVGCGREAPLAAMLYSNRRTSVQYVGVDHGPIEPVIDFNSDKFKPWFIPHTDFMDLIDVQLEGLFEDGYPDVITCFEVLEHVEPDHAYQMLCHMYDLIRPDTGRVMLSTPCFDAQVGPADNHVNELSYHTLGQMIESAGFTIVDKWGTFASQADYKGALVERFGDVGVEMFKRLSVTFDSSVVSNIFATFWPEHSRNVFWILRRDDDAPEGRDKQFPEWVPGMMVDPVGQERGSSKDAEAWDRLDDMMGVKPSLEVDVVEPGDTQL